MEQVMDGVAAVIEKSVPTIVDAAVEAKVKEFITKTGSDLEEVKKAIKEANLLSKSNDPRAREIFAKTAVVSLFKDVMNQGISNEKQFQDLMETTMKTMTEGTATDGAELVFDQFETDVLRVINDYELLSAIRILPLAKGDKVSLPKATNNITTYFVTEGSNYTASEPDTAFVSIDIAKAATLTDMTTELLDDTMTIPDLYNLVVEFIGESQAQFLEGKVLNSASGAIVGILKTSGINTEIMAATDTGTDIGDDELVSMIMKVAKKYKRNRTGVKFVMSQYTQGLLMKLRTLDGYPLYPELRDFQNPKLLGYSVIISDEMPVQDVTDDVADADQILFGDMTYFTLARRKGLSLERGYYGDNWKKDIQSLKSNSRYGGKVTFEGAFCVLRNGS